MDDTTVRRPRPLGQAFWRGLRGACPACGAGKLFRAYLKVQDQCPACGEALHHHRADDAPPYFTILIVGHIVVPFTLWLETTHTPPYWVHFALWIPLIVCLCLALLPVVKGAVVGWQWATFMHGFDPQHRDVYAPAVAAERLVAERLVAERLVAERLVAERLVAERLVAEQPK